MRAECPAHLILIQPNHIWWEVKIIKSLFLHFDAASFRLLSPLSADQAENLKFEGMLNEVVTYICRV